MEAMDKIRARDARRLSPDILKPVTVHTVDDIKRVIGELSPGYSHSDQAQVSTMMETKTDTGSATFRVSATTSSKSKRDHIIDGLDVIKKKMDIAQHKQQDLLINGTKVAPAQLGSSVDAQHWVDPVIKHWLGGYRSGLHICWNIGDGYTYKYDIYAHRLTRIQDES